MPLRASNAIPPKPTAVTLTGKDISDFRRHLLATPHIYKDEVVRWAEHKKTDKTNLHETGLLEAFIHKCRSEIEARRARLNALEAEQGDGKKQLAVLESEYAGSSKYVRWLEAKLGENVAIISRQGTLMEILHNEARVIGGRLDTVDREIRENVYDRLDLEPTILEGIEQKLNEFLVQLRGKNAGTVKLAFALDEQDAGSFSDRVIIQETLVYKQCREMLSTLEDYSIERIYLPYLQNRGIETAWLKELHRGASTPDRIADLPLESIMGVNAAMRELEEAMVDSSKRAAEMIGKCRKTQSNLRKTLEGKRESYHDKRLKESEKPGKELLETMERDLEVYTLVLQSLSDINSLVLRIKNFQKAYLDSIESYLANAPKLSEAKKKESSLWDAMNALQVNDQTVEIAKIRLEISGMEKGISEARASQYVFQSANDGREQRKRKHGENSPESPPTPAFYPAVPQDTAALGTDGTPSAISETKLAAALSKAENHFEESLGKNPQLKADFNGVISRLAALYSRNGRLVMQDLKKEFGEKNALPLHSISGLRFAKITPFDGRRFRLIIEIGAAHAPMLIFLGKADERKRLMEEYDKAARNDMHWLFPKIMMPDKNKTIGDAGPAVAGQQAEARPVLGAGPFEKPAPRPPKILSGDPVVARIFGSIKMRKIEETRTSLREKLLRAVNKQQIATQLGELPKNTGDFETGWKNSLAEVTAAAQIVEIAQLLVENAYSNWLQELADLVGKNPNLCRDICRTDGTSRLVMEVVNSSIRKVDVRHGTEIHDFNKRMDPEVKKLHDMMLALSKNERYGDILDIGKRMRSYKHSNPRTPEFCGEIVEFARAFLELARQGALLSQLGGEA